MRDPFAKFKKQLKQNNVVEEIPENIDSISAAEEENDSMITQQTVESMNLTPKDESFQYVFFPKNDITTYDLARILAITPLMMTPDVYEKFPEDLRKHFTMFTDLKN